MKKYYLIMLMIICFNTQAQIVTIPDTNFKARLLAASTTNQIASSTFITFTPIKIDVNNNGEIEASEALLVQRLNVSNSNCTSLEGISSFTNLKRLECNNNNLVALDVNNLAELRFLKTSYNQLLTLNCNQIENKMEYLDCSHNSLTSIVLPNFYEYTDEVEPLLWLDCSYNQLSSINFTSNINNTNSTGEDFTRIDLSHNNFTSLVLDNINLYGSLDFSFNPLNSLIFQENFYLNSGVPDYPFGSLIVNNTNLVELSIPFDISNGSSISNNSLLTFINLKNEKPNFECYWEVADDDEEFLVCNLITIENNTVLNIICCDLAEVDLFETNYPLISITTTCNLSVDDSKNITSFTLYPNPTKNVLNIDVLDTIEINTISIYNFIGQKLITKSNTNTIDVSTLPKGSYLLTLETTSGTTTKMFIKM